MLSLCAFFLALCSIAYELLLGQTLSAFLGNTVLRYSVTIGLYMMSMGVGALFARRKILEYPLRSLQYVELALSLLGGLSLSFLFLVYSLGLDGVGFSVLAHFLIIVIGVLTGLELPLLFSVARAAKGTERSIILGIDYIGAFAGTLLFAFVLYPELGLFPSCFLVASVNAVVGLMLLQFHRSSGIEKELHISHKILGWQALVLVACLSAYLYSDLIHSFWLGIYTSG
ncbi:MAG: hypothetical protein KDD64_05555 [Bdellovibrionales bacterium]|nr:hypothetical protein [Bdellovibrionales bacterium]